LQERKRAAALGRDGSELTTRSEDLGAQCALERPTQTAIRLQLMQVMSVADEDTMGSDDRGSLERVRELLFGARSRDMDQRVAKLEARVTRELAAVRDELRRRFSELESHVREEIEAVSARLDAEATARVDATSLLTKETHETATGLELRVNRIEEAGARGQRELRRQLLDMTRELGTQIARARQELLSSMEQERAEPVGAASESIENEQAERPSLH
jgi:DNA anti-recombination protein RmuC